MPDHIYAHRGKLHCRHCGHTIPLDPGGIAAWKKQADTFALFHQHKNEAPQRLDPAGEQIKNPRSSTHEQDHSRAETA